jgi:hypothetical protein
MVGLSGGAVSLWLLFSFFWVGLFSPSPDAVYGRAREVVELVQRLRPADGFSNPEKELPDGGRVAEVVKYVTERGRFRSSPESQLTEAVAELERRQAAEARPGRLLQTLWESIPILLLSIAVSWLGWHLLRRSAFPAVLFHADLDTDRKGR